MTAEEMAYQYALDDYAAGICVIPFSQHRQPDQYAAYCRGYWDAMNGLTPNHKGQKDARL